MKWPKTGVKLGLKSLKYFHLAFTKTSTQSLCRLTARWPAPADFSLRVHHSSFFCQAQSEAHGPPSAKAVRKIIGIRKFNEKQIRCNYKYINISLKLVTKSRNLQTNLNLFIWARIFALSCPTPCKLWLVPTMSENLGLNSTHILSIQQLLQRQRQL